MYKTNLQTITILLNSSYFLPPKSSVHKQKFLKYYVRNYSSSSLTRRLICKKSDQSIENVQFSKTFYKKSEWYTPPQVENVF